MNATAREMKAIVEALAKVYTVDTDQFALIALVERAKRLVSVAPFADVPQSAKRDRALNLWRQS